MKKWWKSKVSRIILGLVITGVVVLAVGLPALADSPVPATAVKEAPNLVKGKVMAVDAVQRSFRILTASDDNLTFTVDNNTQYYAAGVELSILDQSTNPVKPEVKGKQTELKNGQDKAVKANGKLSKNAKQMGSVKSKDDVEHPSIAVSDNSTTGRVEPGTWGKVKSWFNRSPKLGEKVGFSDLAVGDDVLVKVMPGQTLAKQVLIFKAPDVKTVTGQITALTTDSVTVTPANGTAPVVNLKWDKDSRINIKGAVQVMPGQYCTAVYTVSTMTIRQMSVFSALPAAATAAGDLD